MASTVLLAAFAIVVIIVVVGAVYLTTGAAAPSGMHTVAIQMTDPPSVPQGTQALIMSYSSVQVQTSGNSNSSGWVSASGSGTLNLVALTNVSQTIATTDVAANSTINVVKFNITSVKIEVNGTTYNVSSPNRQVTVAITGQSKVNSSAAVLIDFFPTVSGSASANGYVMAPAARAIVVNSNSSVSVNTNIGSTASISSQVGARLGLASSGGICVGVGGGPCGGGGNVGLESLVVVGSGNRVSNFMVESVNSGSGTVSGQLYTEYPVATNVGTNTTISVNGTIGYACDDTQYTLVNVYANGSASFAHDTSNATIGGCPI